MQRVRNLRGEMPEEINCGVLGRCHIGRGNAGRFPVCILHSLMQKKRRYAVRGVRVGEISLCNCFARVGMNDNMGCI